MERLWTPWRMSYVSERRRTGCVLCLPDSDERDVDDLVLYRGAHAYVILNLYPYNTGHMMVVPYQHVASIEDATQAARHEMIDLVSMCVEVARRVFQCDGFNTGMNLGETAGAGVAQHIHLHVVPRWTGDANFMPILGATIVLPELLPATYARLRAELEVKRATRERGEVAQAGAVVVLPDSGTVVLRRSVTGDVVLPKGNIEAGESAVDAALREVLEETGVAATLAGWAGTSSFQWKHDDGRREQRFVAYVIGTGLLIGETGSRLDANTLHVPIDDAADELSVPQLSELVRTLQPVLHRLCGDRP